MKALIIDDSATMRKILKDALSKVADFDISDAENCDEGLVKLTTESFNLILLDWNMPGMSGIDFTKKVRSIPSLAKIPIVMITSNAEKQHVLSAVMAGVNDYMVKPFKAEMFNEKISKVLAL